MKKNRVGVILLVALFSVTFLYGCKNDNNSADGTNNMAVDNNTAVSSGNGITSNSSGDIIKFEDTNEYDKKYSKKDMDYDNATIINLSECDKVVEITKAGSYRLSGNLSGKIKVDVEKEDTVFLILEGVTITNEDEECIKVKSAGKVVISVMKDTNNVLTSGKISSKLGTGKVSKDASGAVIDSKDDITIDGKGNLEINAYINNGIYSKNDIKIYCANITISAMNNAIKAKDSVVINSGNIEILASNEGIESNLIEINGGNITINSTDDGINASVGDEVEIPTININGGVVYVNSQGDGLDSNGNIYVNGGITIIYGPTNAGNGALDAGTEDGGKMLITGGTVMALGNGGMLESFGSDSTQCSVGIYLDNTYSAGDMIRIVDNSGNEIFACHSEKTGNSLVYSSANLKLNENYILYVGNDEVTFTVDSIATIVGNSQGFGHGGRHPGDFGNGDKMERPSAPDTYERPTQTEPPMETK